MISLAGKPQNGPAFTPNPSGSALRTQEHVQGGHPHLVPGKEEPTAPQAPRLRRPRIAGAAQAAPLE